jgi:Zn-dependent M16 (insulinase) family peptidase
MTIPRTLIALLAALSLLAPAFGQDPAPAAPAKSAAATDLDSLVNQIRAKLSAGPRTAEALAPELAQFDALRAKYAADKSEDVAQIAMMHASLFAQVFNDEEKAKTLLTALKSDFPGTKAATAADAMLVRMSPEAKAKTKAAAEERAAKLAALS